jgi:tetratricopeptide (TPR) repeat protein
MPSKKKAFLTPGVIAVLVILWIAFRDKPFVVNPNADRNILLVTIDTLRADALGSYGGRATTPNLDRLASHGARFEFAHAHSVVTLPSHASILSGTYPYEHGIRDNTGYRFPQTTPTAATLLKARGFSTGAFIGGFPLDRRFGLGVGFDVYDDNLGKGVRTADGERERRADVVVASALDWIGKQQRNWFAWVHVYDPHVSYSAPAEWASRFPSDAYLAEVSWTDAALGALFGRLATQSKPTLVVITGDHGESLGEHGELTHSVFAYESTLRVPLIVAEIGSSKNSDAKAVTIGAPVRHVDVLPTLLEAAGAPAAPAVSGTSLAPLIKAKSGPDRPSYFEAMTNNLTRGWAPLRGVIVGREKFIDLPVAELYDLAADSAELRNIYATRTDRAQVLFNTLKGFSVAPPGRPKAETPETIEALRSLGYLGGGSAKAREKYTEADDPKRLIELEQAMTQGTDAFRAGRFDEAEQLFQGVIGKRQDTEDAYRKLALVYWRTGRPQLAIQTLELALRNGVTQSEVRIKLGQYLAEAGQPAKAIQLLETFAGDDPDALIALGNAYQIAGRTRDAVRTFRHLIDVDPSNGLAHENIGVALLESKDIAGAEAALHKALAVDPTLPGAHTALGVVFAQTGRRAEAIAEWKKAVEIDDTAFFALYNLTVNLVQSGQMDEARRYGQRFIETAPPGMRADVEAIKKLLQQ